MLDVTYGPKEPFWLYLYSERERERERERESEWECVCLFLSHTSVCEREKETQSVLITEFWWESSNRGQIVTQLQSKKDETR